MRTSLLKAAVICSVALASQLTTRANDIVDFLRAVNGVSERRAPVTQSVSRHGYPGRGVPVYGSAGRPVPGYQTHMAGRPSGFEYGDGRFEHHGVRPEDRVSFREPVYPTRSYPTRSRARVTFNVSTGGYQDPSYIPAQEVRPLPPVDHYPVAPAVPSHGYEYPMQYEVGQIVDCRVPLATCVRVEDECNIAPNAVPVVVAVKDPNACAHNPNAMVFVEVCVPPCPPEKVRISPCRTRVTMCFGQYEVDIKSRNGMILVDYDN